MTAKDIAPGISYLPATLEPFSADVTFIKTDKATWIYDVGADPAQAEFINSLPGPKKVVISHFHADHITNLDKVSYDELFVCAYTKKHTDKLTEGSAAKITVVDGPMTFAEEPEIKLLEMPSSHAKGSLCLQVGDYLLTGDSTYCAEVKGNHHFNTQLLKAEMDFLKACDCPFITMSHYVHFVQKRDETLALLKDIYKRRKPGDPVISVEDFFTENGSPNDRETKGE